MKITKPIFAKIETSRNLPSLPQILLKLLEVCNREDTTFKDMSHIIEKDPSLTTKVVRMVNSSYYGLPNRVTGIEQALLLLGIDAVKNIAISASICRAFSQIKTDSVFNLKRFWWHSLFCAALSKLVAKKSLYSAPDEAFLAGLLHDIGKLVLWVNFTKEYTDLLRSQTRKTSLLLPETEEMRLGTTHSEVGAWLTNRWNLQSFITDAVLYHHETSDLILDSLPLTKIIFVSNMLTSDTDDSIDPKLETAKLFFNFSTDETEELLSQAREEVEQVASSMGIEVESPDGSDRSFDKNDHDKHNELINEVCNVSLLQGTLQNLVEANDKDSILGVIRQGFQVLFDIHNIFFFIYDDELKTLTGRGGKDNLLNDQVKELVIPFEKSKNIFIRSLSEGIILDSFDTTKKSDLKIIDLQIIRLMGSDGIMCFPMKAHQQIIGSIVIALDKTHYNLLSNQMKSLTMFANQAALAIHANNLRQAQAKKIQSERFDALISFAKNVGHEVNNPLTIMKNYIQILQVKLKKNRDHSVQDELRILNEEIDRIALIINDLSDISKPKLYKTAPIDINYILTDFVKISRESLMRKSNINIHLKLEPSLPPVIGEKNSIKQIFINLIKNAVEAMSQGGNLYINTNFMEIAALDDDLKLNINRDRDYVKITVKDDGHGIPEKIKSKVFEPLISTKGGKHRGVGLSIVYNIINELNGAITCESVEKSGTSFNIVLPVSNAKPT